MNTTAAEAKDLTEFEETVLFTDALSAAGVDEDQFPLAIQLYWMVRNNHESPEAASNRAIMGVTTDQSKREKVHTYLVDHGLIPAHEPEPASKREKAKGWIKTKSAKVWNAVKEFRTEQVHRFKNPVVDTDKVDSPRDVKRKNRILWALIGLGVGLVLTFIVGPYYYHLFNNNGADEFAVIWLPIGGAVVGFLFGSYRASKVLEKRSIAHEDPSTHDPA